MIKASIRSKGKYAHVKIRGRNTSEGELVVLAAQLAKTVADECYGGDAEKVAEKIKGAIRIMADNDS